VATHRRSFFNSLTPDTSGNCWWEPSSIYLANDLYPTLMVLRYKDTSTKISASGSLMVPKNYVGTAKVGAVWLISVTSGNVQISCDYRSIAAAESFDPTTHQESVNSGAVAVPGTTLLLKETLIALTSGNLAVDDILALLLSRDGSSGNDTAAADLILVDAFLEWADA